LKISRTDADATTDRPLTPLVMSGLPSGVGLTPEMLVRLRHSPIYRQLQGYFTGWPPQSFMTVDSRVVLYLLIRLLRPKVVVEVGTLFAGTTEVMARALWENGEGVLHTTDPYGVERCPKIIGAWPPELRDRTHFYPLNSMDFFLDLERRRIALDMVLVDGNHDYEFALFDLHMAAKLLRPGGIIVMDNAEQIGPYQASLKFLAGHSEWRELGNAIASYDPLNPFDATRSSLPGTTFILLQAPNHVSIDAVPYSWGQQFIEASCVEGFSLDLAAQRTAGTLFYQTSFRAYGDGNRAGAELKSLGNIRIDLDGPATVRTHRLETSLRSDMAMKYDDARFSFEIGLSWKADPGAPPLALAHVPMPLTVP
jgi:predicted O-methyltransferase YrrM